MGRKKNLKDSKQILKKNYIVDGQALNQGIPKIVSPPPFQIEFKGGTNASLQVKTILNNNMLKTKLLYIWI